MDGSRPRYLHGLESTHRYRGFARLRLPLLNPKLHQRRHGHWQIPCLDPIHHDRCRSYLHLDIR